MISLLLASLVACSSSTPEVKTAEKPASAEKADKPAKPASVDIPAPADVAAPPADAQKTASGIAYKVLTPGTGAVHPGPEDKVEVNYTGWTTDGKMFDSSILREKPQSFPLTGVIKGWIEGVQLMVTNEKTRFWIP